MRWFLGVAPLLFLLSCGTSATLFTDQSFRGAAPEVVRAWKSLGPFHDARTVDLPPGAGYSVLAATLDLGPRSQTVLVGAALSANECRELETNHPTIRFLFFGPPTALPGMATLSVRRSQAWALVGKKAATPGSATVVYPADVTSQEVQEFETAWSGGGGGPLFSTGDSRENLFAEPTSQVFFWGGTEREPQVQALASSIAVHGNPGTLRSPGATGLSWRINEDHLGDFLWETATRPEKKSAFLPLETVLVRR